jgi:enoyl-CoA hydratase/carnithine racemase
MLTSEAVSDRVQVVTMRWPEKRNSLAPEDTKAVAAAITDAGRAADCVILTGDGAFCSGGDLKRFADISATVDHATLRDHVYGDVQAMMRSIETSPVPVIAAVDGPAVGLGMDLALACDICFVGPDGWMQQGWGRAGLIAGTGGIAFLQTVRPKLLWRLLADQERLSADRCEEFGLAEPGHPTARAAAIGRAGKLVSIGRDVLSTYTRLARTQTWPDSRHMGHCAEAQARYIGSANFRELAARVLGRAAQG